MTNNPPNSAIVLHPTLGTVSWAIPSTQQLGLYAMAITVTDTDGQYTLIDFIVEVRRCGREDVLAELPVACVLHSWRSLFARRGEGMLSLG